MFVCDVYKRWRNETDGRWKECEEDIKGTIDTQIPFNMLLLKDEIIIIEHLVRAQELIESLNLKDILDTEDALGAIQGALLTKAMKRLKQEARSQE